MGAFQGAWVLRAMVVGAVLALCWPAAAGPVRSSPVRSYSPPRPAPSPGTVNFKTTRLATPVVKVAPAAPGRAVFAPPARPPMTVVRPVYSTFSAPAGYYSHSPGPPWWFWLMLYNQHPDRRHELLEDRGRWTRDGECFRCHHQDPHGAPKGAGEW